MLIELISLLVVNSKMLHIFFPKGNHDKRNDIKIPKFKNVEHAHTHSDNFAKEFLLDQNEIWYMIQFIHVNLCKLDTHVRMKQYNTKH